MKETTRRVHTHRPREECTRGDPVPRHEVRRRRGDVPTTVHESPCLPPWTGGDRPPPPPPLRRGTSPETTARDGSSSGAECRHGPSEAPRTDTRRRKGNNNNNHHHHHRIHHHHHDGSARHRHGQNGRWWWFASYYSTCIPITCVDKPTIKERKQESERTRRQNSHLPKGANRMRHPMLQPAVRWTRPPKKGGGPYMDEKFIRHATRWLASGNRGMSFHSPYWKCTRYSATSFYTRYWKCIRMNKFCQPCLLGLVSD